jgi:hypothetical protein
MTGWLTAVVMAVAVATAGCSDPYADEPAEPRAQATASHTASPTAIPPAPEVGDTVPRSEPSEPVVVAIDRRARRSPAALVRAYARVGINWDWRTVDDQLERSLVLAGEPLADDLRRTAQDARSDESLERDRPGSRGHVVSVTIQGRGATRRVVVVTREEALRDGRGMLEGARTRVYRGRMRRGRSGWRMVDWQLEP